MSSYIKFSQLILLMSHIAKQLDYKKDVYIHPSYRLNKILPQSGLTTATESLAGGQETIFELPAAYAMNLAQSFITFQFRVPAGPNPGYNNVFKDCFPHWRQFQLYTRSGIYICDLNEVSNYTKVTFNAETPLQEYLDIDFMNGVAGAAGNANATPGNIGSGFHLHRSGVLKDSYTGNAARPGINGVFGNNPTLTFPNGAVNTAPGGEIHIPLQVGDVTLGNMTVAGIAATPAASYFDYTEPSYVYRSTLEAGGAESVLNMNVMLPMKYIKNTIFSVDKDIYFGEIILLRIVWGPSTKTVFSNTGALNLATGALATTNEIGISNLALYLAVEKNPEITNQLRTQVASTGLNVLIPYVYTYKNNLNGTSQNVSLRFNRGHGRKLVKIYHALFNNTESSYLAYDHNNINGAKCSTYYTMLNNERLQEYNIDCTQLDDYNLQRGCLKDKVLQAANIYQYNWFHMDNFTGKDFNSTNLEDGLDLSIEQKWDIYCTTANTQFNHYDFAVTQKMLTISSSGISVI